MTEGYGRKLDKSRLAHIEQQSRVALTTLTGVGGSKIESDGGAHSGLARPRSCIVLSGKFIMVSFLA
jgi:hypothetical protein